MATTDGLVERPGSTYGGEVPRHFFFLSGRSVISTRELSIFVDESGDFGPFDSHTPFYIFTLVLHNQADDIHEALSHLEKALRESGAKENHCFHVGPLIRREEDYQYLSIPERRRLLNKLVAFIRHINIRYNVCAVEKKQAPDAMSLTIALSKQLSRYLSDNLSFFHSFDRIVVYYDNGQVELNRVLASVFAVLLPHAEFRKVLPSQYRLFQVADLLCTMELTAMKAESHMLSKSEISFFGSARDMRKNYLIPLQKLKSGNKA